MKRFLRIISILLVLATLLSTVVSCGLLSGTEGGTDSLDSSDLIESVLDSLDKLDTSEIASDILSEYDTDVGTGDSPLVPDPEEKPEEDTIEEIYNVGVNYISYDYEDYVGDIETFVYGLMIRQLKLFYDVFPSYVELVSGDYVYGLCYTDNSELYTIEDESQYFVMCGFLPFPGEVEVDEDNFSLGLYINDLEYPNNETKYVWKYKSEPVDMHCVVYGQYLVYGVDENGCMYFTDSTLPVANGAYDFEGIRLDLPHLYSYDEGRIVFYTTNNAPTIFTGDTLSKIIDYDQLQKEIDNVIINQDLNFTTVEVENAIYLSQEAIEAYFLSYQEETFLGISVEALLEATRDLDPQECYRITEDGITVLEIGDPPPPQPKLITKWLVGIGSVLVFAVGMAFTSASYAVPALKPLLGAVGGAMAAVAIDIFMQVVVGNTALQNINWKSVGISCVSGAISGVIGPVLQDSIGNKVAYYIVDTVVDAITGGVENAALSWMEGDSGQEIGKSFGDGFAMGLVFSGVFKLIFDGGPALARYLDDVFESNAIYNGLKKIVSIITIPAKWVGDLLTNGIAAMANGIVNISDDVTAGILARRYKNTLKCVEEIQGSVKPPNIDGGDLSIDKTFDKMDENAFFDLAGNKTTKIKILESFGDASIDDELGSFYAKCGDSDSYYRFSIFKKGKDTIGLEINDSRTPTVLLDSVSDYQADNAKSTIGILRERWIEKTGDMPDWAINALKKYDPNLSTSKLKEVKAFLEKTDVDSLKKMLYDNGAYVTKIRNNQFALLPNREFIGVLIGTTKETPDFIKNTFYNKINNDALDLDGNSLGKGTAKIKRVEELVAKAKVNDRVYKRHLKTPTYGDIDVYMKKYGNNIFSLDADALPDTVRLNPGKFLTSDRDANFRNAVLDLKRIAATNPDAIPMRFRDDFMKLPQNQGKTFQQAINDMSADDIVKFVRDAKKCKFVFHESPDGKIYLVPRELHDLTNDFENVTTGISHSGPVSMYKVMKAKFGEQYADKMAEEARKGANKIHWAYVIEVYS